MYGAKKSLKIYRLYMFFFSFSKKHIIFEHYNVFSMTELGKYLKQKSVNKSEIARKTGISSARLSELSRNEKTKIKAEELYLISLALDASASEILIKLYGHLELKN